MYFRLKIINIVIFSHIQFHGECKEKIMVALAIQTNELKRNSHSNWNFLKIPSVIGLIEIVNIDNTDPPISHKAEFIEKVLLVDPIKGWIEISGLSGKKWFKVSCNLSLITLLFYYHYN